MDVEDKDGAAAVRVPRATLTLKTYDPESGVVLKFKTDRAAEVGRLVGSLGRVGRHMAALPQKDESKPSPDSKPRGHADQTATAHDAPMEDASLLEKAVETVKEALPAGDSKPLQQGASGGAGKKKKNKGKK